MAKDSVIVSQVDVMKLKKSLYSKLEETKAFIIEQLSFIGEECVKIAREKGSYNDISGNLRSSIGYVVLEDGKAVTQGQSQQYSGSKGDGQDGPVAVQSLLNKLQSEFPSGIVLIVCAGMKYAYYVENIHHKDVLTSAKLKSRSLAKQLLSKLTE